MSSIKFKLLQLYYSVINKSFSLIDFILKGIDSLNVSSLAYRNGIDTEEEIYRITYFGKGRMPVSFLQSTHLVEIFQVTIYIYIYYAYQLVTKAV